MKKTALSIAGSDPIGGAGIQADLKTMLANGVYGMSVVTAMTAQNTMGVEAIQEATPAFLAQQLDCVFTDIFPDAVKIGMVSSTELIDVIADKLLRYEAKNIVLDPVMVATSGGRLLSEDATDALWERLVPLAAIVTPNIPEAEILCRRLNPDKAEASPSLLIQSEEDMQEAARILGEAGRCAVLVKGGHLGGADDVLYLGGAKDTTDNTLAGTEGTGRDCIWFRGERIDNPNTHGTGCTLSAAIAAHLARGSGLAEAVRLAREYVAGALRAGLDLGDGCGPLDHGFFARNAGKKAGRF